eukprot:scaffold1821_cov344-Pavlova_lutheri.AAC.45
MKTEPAPPRNLPPESFRRGEPRAKHTAFSPMLSSEITWSGVSLEWPEKLLEALRSAAEARVLESERQKERIRATEGVSFRFHAPN